MGSYFHLKKDIVAREGSSAQTSHPGPGVSQRPSLEPAPTRFPHPSGYCFQDVFSVLSGLA